VGSHDTASAVAAVPAETARYAYISCGTWSLMGVVSPQPIINEKALSCNLTNEGGIGGFRVLRNIIGLWLVQECRRTWAAQGRELDYSTITRMAAEAPSFRSLINPDEPAFFTPGDMPARIREYCAHTGQPVPETEGQVVRTALESLALKYRWSLERLVDLSGPIEVIHMVGGGTKNTLLCQLTADATGLPVAAGPVEATAIGNILVQAEAMGEIGGDDRRRIVRESFPLTWYEPRGDASEAWERFRKLP
ncbi:MAG: rhamnulokinase, partial [Armatimonadota bacterium]